MNIFVMAILQFDFENKDSRIQALNQSTLLDETYYVYHLIEHYTWPPLPFTI